MSKSADEPFACPDLHSVRYVYHYQFDLMVNHGRSVFQGPLEVILKGLLGWCKQKLRQIVAKKVIYIL